MGRIGEIEGSVRKQIGEELFNSFFPPQKNPSARAPQLQYRKPGQREERMAQYTPAEKIKDAKRKEELERREEAATSLQQKVIDTNYYLAKIAEEHQPTAQRLNELLNNKSLSPSALRSLFSKGSLTQKIFLAAIDDHQFTQTFGTRNVNSGSVLLHIA